MNIAIIPARKGSKGLLNKNIALLKGKQLILYTLEEALKCTFIDKVVVTTDSEEVLSLARDYTPNLVWRPKELAVDNAPLAPTIIHALQRMELFYGKFFDNIITLQPTSPLRKAKHIREAFERFRKLACDSLLSVTEELHSIWASENGYAQPLVYSKINRQHSKPHYLGNGAIFITKRQILIDNKDRIGGNVGVHPMDTRSSLDIHTAEDLSLAEYYMRVK